MKGHVALDYLNADLNNQSQRTLCLTGTLPAFLPSPSLQYILLVMTGRSGADMAAVTLLHLAIGHILLHTKPPLSWLDAPLSLTSVERAWQVLVDMWCAYEGFVCIDVCLLCCSLCTAAGVSGMPLCKRCGSVSLG